VSRPKISRNGDYILSFRGIVKFGERWHETTHKVKRDVDDGAGKIREKYDESRNMKLRHYVFLHLSQFREIFSPQKKTVTLDKLSVQKSTIVG